MTIARRSACPIVGSDGAEDFLDLAIVDAAGRQLRLARVAVRGVERGQGANDFAAISELRRRLVAAAPELERPKAELSVVARDSAWMS